VRSFYLGKHPLSESGTAQQNKQGEVWRWKGPPIDGSSRRDQLEKKTREASSISKGSGATRGSSKGKEIILKEGPEKKEPSALT